MRRANIQKALFPERPFQIRSHTFSLDVVPGYGHRRSIDELIGLHVDSMKVLRMEVQEADLQLHEY